MEGVSGEAASLAGHLRSTTSSSSTTTTTSRSTATPSLAFTEDRAARYAAYGWHTLTVDGRERPRRDRRGHRRGHRARGASRRFISVKTIIGYGSIDAGTSRAHSDARGPEQQAQTKRALGFDPDEVLLLPDARPGALPRRRSTSARRRRREWKAAVGPLPRARRSPELVDRALRRRREADGRPAPRRARSSPRSPSQVPQLVGGSADLTPSNNTRPEGWERLPARARYAGRYLRFGVREHGMSAIANGLAAVGPAAVRRRRSSTSSTTRSRRCGSRRSRGCPVDLGLHPRLGRARRGRPDPPADRAAGDAARDARRVRVPARRRERDDRGLAVALAATCRPRSS